MNDRDDRSFTRKSRQPLRTLARKKMKNPQQKIAFFERLTEETFEEKKKANRKG